MVSCALLAAGCTADPVGGTGVRAEMPPDIGSSTPDSFLPQASTMAPSTPSPADRGPEPADPMAADPTAMDDGTDDTDPSSTDGGAPEEGREPIPICDPTELEDDAGAAPSGCAVAGDLVVQYRVGDTDPADQQIRAQFNLVNHGATAIPLEELTLRYWYTKETGPPAQEFHCDYARIDSALVAGSFGTTDLPGVDHYMEVSFTGGTLPAGGDTGEIQTRFNTETWPNYDETDDYSYDGTITEYEDWDRVTLYLNGQLIWGAEPH